MKLFVLIEKFTRRVRSRHYADARELASVDPSADVQRPMTKSTARAPLRSLSPQYDEAEHADYVEILKTELLKSDDSAPRNIALTGHYGSGKSSVLLEVQKQLEKAKLRVINLSLPSLGIGARSPAVVDGPELDTTNLIQKEIVKQLLYRRSPSNMPASRYKRLDVFRAWPAYRRAIWIAVAFALVALLLKVPTKLEKAFPPEFWNWVDDHLWGNPATFIQWLSLLVVFGLTVAAAMWAQRLLQQQLRVTELGAGTAKVTLSDQSTSYFDEYLDEIVYYFQTSKTTIVIFEDLDRFKDPHIFETLRELNLLLNNAAQIEKTPIRFVYAIRDSIFEQLAVGERIRDDEGHAIVDGDPVETRRLTSTNRTKFFDLVVPMVPFISHRTSRDLILSELKSIDDDQRPGSAVVNLVSVHLTDMRLIKNICNEYDVFRRRILREDGLKELTADRLFASIVYKNLYLADYENIRNKTGRLDTLYDTYRDWVSHNTVLARTAERRARVGLRQLDAVSARSDRLGKRLQEVLVARHPVSVKTSAVSIALGGVTQSWSEVREAAFWKTFLTDKADITVTYNAGSYQAQSATVPFDTVQTLMGETFDAQKWAELDRDELTQTISDAVTRRHDVSLASMKDALAQTGQHVEYNGKEQSLASVAAALFVDADLVLDLLRNGFIDENFTLYVTQFPGQSISASAMNFILKAVQPDVMDIEYHFGESDQADTADIDAVLEAEQTRVLDGQSVYNVELFDHILASRPQLLREPIRRLAVNAVGDREFIDAYIASGRLRNDFISALSPWWSDVFEYLIGDDPGSVDMSDVDAALGAVDPNVTYKLNDDQRAVLTEALPDLRSIKEVTDSEQSKRIGLVLDQMGVVLADLGAASLVLRNALIFRSQYDVTLRNLRTIVGGDQELPLDKIKAALAAPTYEHIVSRIDDYLVALSEASDVPTVASEDRFAEILTDVGEVNPAAVESVARQSETGLAVTGLAEVDKRYWPSIASAHRLSLTSANVATYLAEYGVDDSIASSLSEAGAIEVVGESPALTSLALELVNAGAISTEVKTRLIAGLELEKGSIAATSLSEAGLPMVPELVRAGIVVDDSDAWECLDADDWATKEALINASTEFAEYMTSLSLSRDDLFWIAHGDVPSAVTATMLTEIATFESELGPKGAAALARWAAEGDRSVDTDALVILATKSDGSGTSAIVKLLGIQAETIELGSLKSALNGLGDPYDRLTTPGWESPKVPISDSMRSILIRLRSANIVSNFKAVDKKGVFTVSKRRR